MSFIITYKFVGLNEFKGSTINPHSNVGEILNSKTIPVELRDVLVPKETDMVIDSVVLDCITTEVHHSRSIMNHCNSLNASLPAWITDYFTHNETKTLSKGRENTVVLKVFVQLATDKTKFSEMLKNVDFEEIRIRQKWILGKLFSPYAHLPVIDIYQFDPNGKSVMSRPTRVGYFSVKIRNQKGVFFSDKSGLRYFSPPTNVNEVLDLRMHFNPHARWCRSPIERHIVRWYWENETSMHGGTAPNIITDLRTLTTIMASPTNNSEDWEVVCCVFSNQIFMFEVDSHQRVKRVHDQNKFQNLSSYSGYRFEQLVTRRFDGQNCTIHDGGLRDSFHSVNITNIGKHKVLYSARCVAAADKESMLSHIDDMDIVDIKTRARKSSWESRVVSLWVRAILNRVSLVYVGEKNADFMITDITSIPTQQLLPRGYNVEALFNFLHKTLDFITDTCKVDRGVYRFHRTPFLPVIVQKMDATAESVIPRWYVNGQYPCP